MGQWADCAALPRLALCFSHKCSGHQDTKFCCWHARVSATVCRSAVRCSDRATFVWGKLQAPLLL